MSWHEREQKRARCRKDESEILEGKKKEEGEEGNVEGVRVSREWGRHDITPNTKTLSVLRTMYFLVIFIYKAHIKLIYQDVLFLSLRGNRVTEAQD